MDGNATAKQGHLPSISNLYALVDVAARHGQNWGNGNLRARMNLGLGKNRFIVPRWRTSATVKGRRRIKLNLTPCREEQKELAVIHQLLKVLLKMSKLSNRNLRDMCNLNISYHCFEKQFILTVVNQ